MKQLRPFTILTVGLPLSFLLNFLFAGTFILALDPEFSPETSWLIALAIAGSTWILLSVPILSGMAVIRSRIGRFTGLNQKIRAAFNCIALCLVLAIFAYTGAYLFRNQQTNKLPIFAAALVFIGFLSSTLALITGMNIWNRSKLIRKTSGPVSSNSANGG